MIIEIKYCRCAVTGEIEMSDIYPSESVSTGEIKVDDAAAVDVGRPSFMRSPPPPPTPAILKPRRERLESMNAKKNGLTFKNPTTRNNQSSI